MTLSAQSLELRRTYVLHGDYALKSNSSERLLFNTRTGSEARITPFLYSLLSGCDGRTSISSLLPQHRSIAPYLDEINGLRRTGVLDEGYARLDHVAPAYDGPKLQRLAVHLTARCNQACLHCYAGDFRGEEISDSDLSKIISGASRMNLLSFSLTGGEPFLVPDAIERICDAATRSGMRIESIFTNGTLIEQHRPLIQRLTKRFQTAFYVSVDSVGPPYDTFRGASGHFRRLQDGLDCLAELGANLVANIIITRLNQNSLRDVFCFLHRYNNLFRIRLDGAFNLGRWRNTRESLAVSPEEELRAFTALYEAWRSLGRPVELEYGRIFRYLYGRRFLLAENHYHPGSLCCEYYRHNAVIMPNGAVVPCVLCYPHYTCGNIRDDELPAIWEGARMRAFKDMRLADLGLEECMACCHLPQCGAGCRGNALLSGEGLTSMDREVCYLFKSGLAQKAENCM